MIEVDVGLDLKSFKLDVAFGDGDGITALFGPSGCGKSLTLGIISGLRRPDRGYVRLDGRPLVDVEKGVFEPPHKRRIGVVFQDSNLFPHLSVRQNLLYGRWFAPKGAERLGFDAAVETLGITKLLDRQPARLSGGERQRVGIGRALLSCPKMLLFDEPLAALDMSRKLEIMPLIERIRDEFHIPMVYVSHAVEEVVRLASRVVVLQNGKVKKIGTPNEAFGADAALEDDRFERASALKAVVGREDAVYGLTELKHPAGTIWVVGAVRPAGREVNISVRASDVILAVEQPKGLSPRNTLAGAVLSIERDSGPTALIAIALEGGERLAATATRKAVEELELKPGELVYAMIKATALDERMMSAPIALDPNL